MAHSNQKTVMEKADYITNKIAFVLSVILYPLAVLSFYQLLAMIPVAVKYMRTAEYTDYILNLQNVSTVSDIFRQTFDILGIFLSDPLFLFLMTIGYALMILTYLARVRFRKHTASFRASHEYIGLPAKGIARKYLTGILLGFVMMGSVFAILLITKQIRLTGIGITSSVVLTFIFNLFMWVPQGASEEVMFRGFMIKEIKPQFGTIVGVIISSVLFSAFHSLNIGFTPLAAVNLLLIALLFAGIYVLTGVIVTTCCIHTMCNLCQGNIFGLHVSGTQSDAALIHTEYLGSAKDLITGGAFGPEGGLAVTIITIIGLAIITVLMLMKKKTPVKN